VTKEALTFQVSGMSEILKRKHIFGTSKILLRQQATDTGKKLTHFHSCLIFEKISISNNLSAIYHS